MKRLLPALALAAAGLAAAPVHAGSFGVFGSYWDTKDADRSFGGGVRSSFGDALQLDFRGTYFNDLRHDGTNDFRLHAAPLDAGLSVHFQNPGSVEPYLGGGASYFLLDSNRGHVDDEVGFYGVGGLELGSFPSGGRVFVEALYRDVHGTVKNRRDDLPDVTDTIRLQLRGLSVDAGFLWHF